MHLSRLLVTQNATDAAMLYSDVPASNHLPTCTTFPRGHIFKSIHYVCTSMYYTVVQLHKIHTSLDTQSRYKTPRGHRGECARIFCRLWASNHIDNYASMHAHRVCWNMHVFVKIVQQVKQSYRLIVIAVVGESVMKLHVCPG